MKRYFILEQGSTYKLMSLARLQTYAEALATSKCIHPLPWATVAACPTTRAEAIHPSAANQTV